MPSQPADCPIDEMNICLGTPDDAAGAEALDKLAALEVFLLESRRLLVLTGAGCSTQSGIPDYRDADGEWKHRHPVLYQDFVSSRSVRQRYWARSLIGWRRVADAAPNRAHRALARMEQAGLVHHLVTQNVDGLHHRAGSRKVIDLHGRLDVVDCLACGHRTSREHFQDRLERDNPGLNLPSAAVARPDGDVDPGAFGYDSFEVPSCRHCGGILKPGVVFFGEPVPRERVRAAFARLGEADALLIVGSSLMVFSGYRFARAAFHRGLPVALINLGRTRADGEISLKVRGQCGDVLTEMQRRLKHAPGRIDSTS
ncbi:NAD-dependent protein deacetylase [soil metagenome]